MRYKIVQTKVLSRGAAKRTADKDGGSLGSVSTRRHHVTLDHSVPGPSVLSATSLPMACLCYCLVKAGVHWDLWVGRLCLLPMQSEYTRSKIVQQGSKKLACNKGRLLQD